jgi:uncharacterized protein YecE (DUF72 family)
MPAPLPLLRCGVAGWLHPRWDRFVYPRPRRASFHPLQFLAHHLDAVEIPGSPAPIRPELARLWLTQVAHNPRFQFTARVPLSFTMERSLDAASIRQWREGIQPIFDAGKLGCAVMEFSEAFRFSRENRQHLIAVRRALHPLPLVAELRHQSWTSAEGRGTLIDYHIGFCNLDIPRQVVATPPTSFLTWKIGYVMLRGATGESHLFSPAELAGWKTRIARFAPFSDTSFVIFGNWKRGKSVVNALQMRSLLSDIEAQPATLNPAVAATPRLPSRAA